ncbi:MAG: hypothetical protein F7B60_05280 [Desulfurococcales archaeon]|nr:hypothetical protein [Desulfurococcales archaeon]
MIKPERFIIKLGGSVITKKDRRYKADKESLCQIVDHLKVSKPLVIVHGGGSFGHYMVYNILQRKARLEHTDLPQISYIMDKLNQEVIQCLLDKGIPAVSFPPHSLCRIIDSAVSCNMETMKEAVSRRLVPVLYGDSVLAGNGIEILSGDTLTVLAAREINVKRLYFLTDVDGLYEDLETKEIVRHLVIKKGEPLPFNVKGSSTIDVTGGMRAKINSLKNLLSGSKVYILNGRNQEHLYRALIKGENPSTLIEVYD